MDVTKIFLALLSLAVLIATGFLIPIARAKLQDSKVKQFILDNRMLAELARIGCTAVEQAIVSPDGKKMGAEKKAAVLNWLKDTLAAKGLTFDMTTMDMAIEQAVYELNHDLVSLVNDTLGEG